MKSPVTIDSLLNRIKKEVAQKAVVSEKKKLEAKTERSRRAEPIVSMYAKEELWLPVAIHRQYQVQICSCCSHHVTCFLREQVQLQHKIDRSAKKWTQERGQALDDLPVVCEFIEVGIPECFACYSVGSTFNHLWKGQSNHGKEAAAIRQENRSGSTQHQEGNGGAHAQAGQQAAA